jgi:hypothetical protein
MVTVLREPYRTRVFTQGFPGVSRVFALSDRVASASGTPDTPD